MLWLGRFIFLSVGNLQATYLMKRVERFNADLGAPVVLAGGFEAPPMSAAYEVRAGARPFVPTCPSAVRLSFPPARPPST